MAAQEEDVDLLQYTSILDGKKRTVSKDAKLEKSQIVQFMRKIGEMRRPSYLMYTRAFAVPHLTLSTFREFLQPNLQQNQQIFNIPLSGVHHCLENVENQRGVSNFAPFPENSLLYLSVQDKVFAKFDGEGSKKGVNILAKGGKRLVEAEKYAKIAEFCHVDAVETLADWEVGEKSGRKRLEKATARTEKFSSRFFDNFQKKTRDFAVFYTLTGGFSLEERKRALEGHKKYAEHVDGFVVDGFNLCGNLENVEIRPIVDLLKRFSPSWNGNPKPVILHGAFSPSQIADLAELNVVDFFDNSYCCLKAESGVALLLSFEKDKTQVGTLDFSAKNAELAEQFGPISEICRCYACSKFSRAYVHHMVQTGEILGKMLLMTHNLVAFDAFFAALKQ